MLAGSCEHREGLVNTKDTIENRRCLSEAEPTTTDAGPVASHYPKVRARISGRDTHSRGHWFTPCLSGNAVVLE